MNIPSPLQKAVGRFDWPAVEAHVTGIAPNELQDAAETMLDVILRDGYLIVRRPDARQMAKRDSFADRMRAFFRDRGMGDMIDDRAEEFASLGHTEAAYQEVLQSVQTHLLSHLSAEELAWTAIRAVETGTRDMEAKVKQSLPDIEHLIDPVTMKLPVDADGFPASPDGVLNMLQNTLAATLKMLAYGNGWFDRHGAILLPPPVSTSKEQQQFAGANIYLAVAWGQVERSDGRCRYFHGKVTREDVEFQEMENPEQLRRGPAIKFAFKTDLEIMMRVANERQRRMAFGFFIDVDRNQALASRVIETPPIPPAPEASAWKRLTAPSRFRTCSSSQSSRSARRSVT